MSAPFNPELASKREQAFDPALERQKIAWMGYGALASGLLTCASALLLGGGAGAFVLTLALSNMLRTYSQSPLDSETLHARKAELVRTNPQPKTASYFGIALGAVGLVISLSKFL